MATNSISIVVLAREEQSTDVLDRTLSVWTTNLAEYRDGAELILVDMTESARFEEFVNAKLLAAEAPWLRVVYLKCNKSVGAALNLALDYAEGANFLILGASSYPAGNVLDYVVDRLDAFTTVSGSQSWVKAPYNHSFVRDEYRPYSNEYATMDSSRAPWKGVALETLLIPTDFLRRFNGFSEEMDNDDFVAMEIVALGKYNGITAIPIPELHMMRVGEYLYQDVLPEVEDAVNTLAARYEANKFDRRLSAKHKVTKAAK